MRNLFGFSQDKAGILHSEIDGADAFFGLCNDLFSMDVNTCRVQYYTEISQPQKGVIRADYMKATTWATNKGLKLEEASVHFIEYNTVTKSLNTNMTREDLDGIRHLSGDVGSVKRANLLGMPVAAYLRDNKPYCYKVVQDMGSNACSSASATANFISLGILDLADSFERCAKQSQMVGEFWNTMPIEQIIEEYSSKAIPAACRKFVDESSYNVNTRKILTSCLRLVTNKEDGNNAIILTNFLKDSHRLIDKRTWDWERRLGESMKALTQLVEKGYNSVKVLEYVLRQAFYYREFRYPDSEFITLRDYANMMEELNIQNYDRFPTNLNRAHNVAVANINMLKSSDSKETLQAFKKAVDAYRYLEGSVKGKGGKKWILKVPETPQDLVNEGVALSHCVSSYTMLVCSGNAQILFLRDFDNPDVPLYTVDVADEKVVEAKGNANTDVPDEINEVLKTFEKKWKEGKK